MRWQSSKKLKDYIFLVTLLHVAKTSNLLLFAYKMLHYLFINHMIIEDGKSSYVNFPTQSQTDLTLFYQVVKMFSTSKRNQEVPTKRISIFEDPCAFQISDDKSLNFWYPVKEHFFMTCLHLSANSGNATISAGCIFYVLDVWVQHYSSSLTVFMTVTCMFKNYEAELISNQFA